MGAINPPAPLLYGPNSISTGLQNAIGLGNGAGDVLRFNGPKNYMGFGNFEDLLTHSALGVTGTLTNGIPTGSPTFGSGAAGTLLLSVTSSGPLSGLNSLSLASSAASTAGNMVAFGPYAIDIEDQARVLSFKCSYKASVGTWALPGTSANNIGVAFYDATNSAWLGAAGNFNFVQSTGVGIASATVQTASTTASLYVCLYVPTASGAAVTMLFDSPFFGPQTTAQSYAGSDPVPYTPTFVGFGTVTNVDFKSHRDGAYLECFGKFTTGTTTATTASISLGYAGGNSNVTIDSAVLAGMSMVGNGGVGGSSTTFFGVSVLGTGGTSVVNMGIQSSTANELNAATGSGLVGNAVAVNVFFRVPIAGWSSNTVASSDTDTRVVSAKYWVSANFVSSVSIPINFDSKSQDTHGAVTTSATAWKFVAPVTGTYVVSMYMNAGGNDYLGLYKNGTLKKYFGYTPTTSGVGSFTTTVDLATGDYVDLRHTSTLSGNAAENSTNATSVQIFRLSGPAVVTATETVSMKYTNTAGTSIANTGDNNVPFATKAFDSHNAYNTSTGLYTVPVSGKYEVKGTINYASATYGVNNQLLASVYKNSAVDTYGDIAPVMAIVTLPFGSVVDTTVQCNAGDTLELRAQNTRSAGATTLNTGTGMNHLEISRVGN